MHLQIFSSLISCTYYGKTFYLRLFKLLDKTEQKLTVMFQYLWKQGLPIKIPNENVQTGSMLIKFP